MTLKPFSYERTQQMIVRHDLWETYEDWFRDQISRDILEEISHECGHRSAEWLIRLFRSANYHGF